jgi:hypothetical protein
MIFAALGSGDGAGRGHEGHHLAITARFSSTV